MQGFRQACKALLRKAKQLILKRILEVKNSRGKPRCRTRIRRPGTDNGADFTCRLSSPACGGGGTRAQSARDGGGRVTEGGVRGPHPPASPSTSPVNGGRTRQCGPQRVPLFSRLFNRGNYRPGSMRDRGRPCPKRPAAALRGPESDPIYPLGA